METKHGGSEIQRSTTQVSIQGREANGGLLSPIILTHNSYYPNLNILAYRRVPSPSPNPNKDVTLGVIYGLPYQ